MSNREIQNIYNRFTKNILMVQGSVFLLLIGVMIFSTYMLNRRLAEQTARTIDGKIKRGDTREVVNILSDAQSNDFVAVDLYDRNSRLQFTFPTRFRRDRSWTEAIWHYLAYATYEKRIYFDIHKNNLAAIIVFTFGIFQLLPVAFGIFILGLWVSYPLVRKHKELLLENLEKETAKGQTSAVMELARQVRHDYKSPLMAIKSVIDKSQELKSDEKKTLSMAYYKMMGMLSDLSRENIKNILKSGRKNKEMRALTHVYSAILNVVEEKMVRYTSPEIMIKILCSDDDKRAYVLIDDIELQRIVSNLIENSLEALEGVGEVLININTKNANLEIDIEDNGKGIPEHILDRVMQKDFSFGKPNGEGLGLFSSMKKIKKLGGELKIFSRYRQGTKVSIKLPRPVKPQWADSNINLSGIENVVILDDDPSFHQILNKKLRAKTSAVIIQFTNAKKLMKQLKNFNKKTLFLLDYELRGQSETGLDVAENIGPDNRCYLVSNSFQDPKLQRACKRLGIYLLPKTIVN